MANSHPYISGAGNIAQMIAQLRKSFPQKITSDTVKKLGLAPNNESHVINALQFIGLINEEGLKTEQAGKVFSHHKNEDFERALSTLVKEAYSSLFDLHGENTWKLETDDLITFFRQSDQTSDAIGKRQAATFKVFTAVSGYAELPTARVGKTKSVAKKENKTQATHKQQMPSNENLVDGPSQQNRNKDVGLTVRVEINLPANGTKETYDNIFKSIKENLINA